MFSAGVLDAGLSALGSFAVGVYASRTFDANLLGGYALLFTLVFFVALVPAQLLFAPWEVCAVTLCTEERLGLFPHTLSVGGVCALLAALPILAWPAMVGGAVHAQAAMPLTYTAMLCAIVSPLQDHARRMMHIAERSWTAALLSAVHLTIVLSVLLLLQDFGVAAWWVPFGALASGNAFSLALAVVLASRSGSPVARGALPSLPVVLRSGRALLLVGGLPAAAELLIGALVLRIAGASTVGYAEAARVAAQPVRVLAQGLAAVTTPRSMAAASMGNAVEARSHSRQFISVIALGSAAYLVAAGHSEPWNPLSWMLANAYTIHGLVAATVIANFAVALSFPYHAEMLAAGRQQKRLWIEASSNLCRLAVVFATAALGAFTLPISLFVLGIVRSVWCARAVTTQYDAATEPLIVVDVSSPPAFVDQRRNFPARS